MKPKTKNQFITLTALLTALAIVIPMVMPAKIIIPPASYTLASHVPIFLAINPAKIFNSSEAVTQMIRLAS